MKDVLINIKGLQTVDGNEDVLEFTTFGRFEMRKNKTYLFFDESAVLGIDGVKTTVKAQGNQQVVLQRSGGMESRLTIENGQRHLCHYKTAVGEIIVGIFGEKIQNDIDKSGGILKMAYTIDINMNMLSRNEVEILVKEVDNDVNTCS